MDQASNPNFRDQQTQQPVTRKAQMTDLEILIRRERDRNPAVMAFLQLLNLRFEDTKESMVTCIPSQLPELQAAALVLRKLINTLTIDPPPLPSKENYT